ncbi:helix-turn-helix domain-containing protein [Lysinibacillus telephonicus]|uniref:XRE family transcriptional regulator n=1 Tax=Lysinibacillus telephonicus TaxID=1714840 RepID=A0A431UEA1_9BACI|nr:helix-turn-helix transcriptional regulator [Lysinibacillus telephonicus]RTQ87806.1 XRE family transcriptional regulator [Lysinibacillus telephonicus]
MESLGSRLKYLREKSNISQKDFAKKIGVSNTVLSRYESGDRKPDYDILQLIADYFEVM